MTLRTKILIGFGSILALVVFVWAWGITNLYWLGNASDAILRENYQSILAAENMMASLERQDSAVLLIISGDRAEGLEQFRRYEIEFLQWLRRAQDNITIAGESEILDALQDAYTQYLVRFDELISTDEDQASAAYEAAILPQFNLVREEITALRNLNQEFMVEASQRAQTLAQRAIWSTAIIGLAVSILGLLLSLWFSRFLTRPLRAMTAAAAQIADGNYDVKLEMGTGDELGQLAEEISTMSYKLNTFHRLNVGQIFAEKRRSEAIIESITDGLLVVDADLEVIAINPKAQAIFETTAMQAKGRHVFDVVQDRMLYEAIKAKAHNGQTGAAADEPLYHERRHNAVSYHYRFTVTPVKADQNKLLGVVLLLQDVTKLRELDQLKSQFVMTASHELRTPLTGMAMSLGLLAETAQSKLDERERELMSAAKEEVQRLRALVNDLLDLSKIEAGHMEIEFETIAPARLIDKAMRLFKDQAATQEIELTSNVAEPIAPVRADPTKITWVLTNLIGNALRYTDAGGRIKVTARPSRDAVYFAVEDNGAGIPPEYQSRIFDKFVQVKDDAERGGTGLGLAICKEIIKAHEGTIWLDSELDKGSTFTFTLPLAASPSTQANVQQEPVSEELHHAIESTDDPDRG